jgi:hypothetical protein
MNLVKTSFVHASLVTLYIALVATFMQNAERWFAGRMEETILMPISFLMLLVLSAAITGSLVLGKPAMMYFNGQKSEAVTLFLYILGWLALGMILFLLINISLF